MHLFVFANQVITWNFCIGIGGPITYPKNDELRNIVKSVNLKNIILETDAPFLPPQVIRGKQNSPKYIKEIAESIAQVREQSFKEIADKTTENALQLFKIK